MNKKWSKRIGVAMTGVLLAGMLAGCSSSSSKVDSNASGKSDNSGSVAATGADRSKELVIYSNAVADGRGEWLQEKAQAEGFNLTLVDLGGSAITERLIAEKNNQIADLVIGLNAMGYERLVKNDLLISYTPVWASEVDMKLGSPDGYYSPTVVQPLLMAYNTDFISADQAPSSWIDLATNADFAGKHTVLGINGGTSQAIIASMLVEYRDESGEYGISAEGWDMMKQYIQGGHLTQEGEDWFGSLVSGERPICQIWGSGLLQREEEMGLTNLAFVTPEIGVPYVVEQVAICNNSKNTELAKEFVDWFGSAELQGQWAERFGTVPAHPAALEMASEDAQAMIEKVHQQDIDWKFVSENIEKWMEKIQLEFV